MVNINNVRQIVLSILNKENRGYVTGTEFNYIALQAQNEIVESYFNDLPHFRNSPKGSMGGDGYASTIDNIEEKINIFSEKTTLNSDSNTFAYPDNFYRLTDVSYNSRNIEEIPKKKGKKILLSTYTGGSLTFPKYEERSSGVVVYPDTIRTIAIDYIRQPATPVWGSMGGTNADGQRAELYNPATTTHFELHPSESRKLVQLILVYFGVSLREEGLVQIFSGDIQEDIAEEKQ